MLRQELLHRQDSLSYLQCARVEQEVQLRLSWREIRVHIGLIAHRGGRDFHREWDKMMAFEARRSIKGKKKLV